jgi:ubiquinone/menaquinone biosynthesis C-methylase UbiE
MAALSETMANEAAVLDQLKQRARDTWRAGDYAAVAEGIREAGERVVQDARVGLEDRVLDVAAGTGNASIPAAERGARVVGLDLTPELFVAARRRAEEARVEIDWVAGDAEALPFEDESFDVVLSTFGVMFAPRHRVAAHEVARVLRPGGRLAVASWTPDGVVGEMFATIGRYLPPPPPVAEPAILWGTERHVRELFEGTGMALSFERTTIRPDPGLDRSEAVRFYLESFGPLIKARELLEPQGRWRPLAEEVAPVIERMAGGSAEYLVVSGTKAH